MIEYWFRPKRYGYGATPTNWKGWASTSAFAAVLAVLMMTMVLPVAGGRPVWEVLLGWVLVAGVTAVFCQFAKARTNGEWRWRWGDKNKSW
jgi:hypothetical protein